MDMTAAGRAPLGHGFINAIPWAKAHGYTLMPLRGIRRLYRGLALFPAALERRDESSD